VGVVVAWRGALERREAAMFMRFVQMRVDPERIPEFKEVYARTIVPTLRHTPGCAYAALVQSLEDEGDGMSITLWSHEDDALAYERSGKFAEMLNVARPFFSDATEWRVQLSADLQPEFSTVAAEPTVKSYTMDASPLSVSPLPAGRAGPTYLRIVSMKLKPAKRDEFIAIYHREIIPALRLVEGCLDAYLAEGVQGENEVLCITIWSGLASATAYEATGEFDRLKEKVEHTFSNLARWKMALDDVILPGTQGVARRAVTSDDVAVRTYSIVLGKALR
jgi:quinol monooxygenase YgiN